ncbi:arsenate reductase (glutaredoxin) [Roseateles sp. DAIF2]|uniref:arsenate reductase (glutaredoxin) n=1 Tax=Roseateles sp. DAIF2 TaxID=2714952 RepID=UPI0018A24C81|nr:arsenate reductase (glutaredoxin) [Roseateles sp. DAIF2]QPF72948.1 arsenate reductase (glutaredoxin) [Roseateles sp. DAIF2]
MAQKLIRIFHNPRCSKSREALALLQARGLDPEVVDYLQNPPQPGELRSLLAQLGLPARELLRSGEEEYASLGLADASLSDEAVLQAIAAHPKLLQRPIVVHGERAVIARPPELLLQLL